MFRSKLVQIVCLALAGIALAVAAAIQSPFDQLRDDMDREAGHEMTRDFTELKLLQIVPGGLRALAIDYLWIEIERMKQEGKYYDAEQKTDLICKLQPRFPDVWLNRAWNLAYNISHEAQTGTERWERVSQGIELLRNKGLVYNPKSLALYRELAWIHQHKIGELLDDMHMDYKGYFAGEFHRVLGGPPRPMDLELEPKAAKAQTETEIGFGVIAPLDSGTAAEEPSDPLIAAHIAWLTPIVEAPDRVADLLADPDVAAFVTRLNECDVTLGFPFLDAYNAWSNDLRVKMLGQPELEAETDTQRSVLELMTDPALAEVRAKTLAFCRRKALVETYNMRPWWMVRVVKEYGPIDWRTCWPHCLYWASYGLQNCKGYDIDSLVALNSGRLVLNPLKSMMTFGDATLWYNVNNPARPQVMFEPNWRYIDATDRVHMQMKEFYTGRNQGEGTHDVFAAGYENFLKISIQSLFLAGELEKATQYLEKARRLFSLRNPLLYALDLEQFVYQTLNPQGVPRHQDMKALVFAQVQRAYRYMAAGEDDSYDVYLRQAHWFWKRWNEEVRNDPRKAMPPFVLFQANAARVTLTRLPFEGRIALWDYLPLIVRQNLYDNMAPSLRAVCEKRNIDFAKAFPEPPEMDMIRQRQAEIIRQAEDAPYEHEP